MRLVVLQQQAKALEEQQSETAGAISKQLEGIKPPASGIGTVVALWLARPTWHLVKPVDVIELRDSVMEIPAVKEQMLTHTVTAS